MVKELHTALDARRQRIVISESALSTVKWVGILLQGLCTLVAIAMVHSDNRLARAIALTLFATGIALSVLLIAAYSRIGPEGAADMTLWAKFKEFVDRVTGAEDQARNLREEELRLAAAALLGRASVIDGKIDASERGKLKTLLQERFELEDEEIRSLLVEAVVRQHESVDLYRFISVLCRQLDQHGRKRIVEMLWEVVMADGVVHEFESNLVWRVAELLGVSTRDRVILKQAVARRAADS